MVVTAPPLMASVPPALLTRLAAVTAPSNVVAPVLLTAKAPKAPLLALPSAPVNVTAPTPELTMSALAWLAAESTVLAKLTVLSVVVRVAPVPSVTASP